MNLAKGDFAKWIKISRTTASANATNGTVRTRFKMMIAELARTTLELMMPRKHVVITGTGRSGTTFLVELLTHLGLDTGFTPEDLELYRSRSRISRGGLEHDIRGEACPFLVKSPWFCDYAEEILRRDDIQIEHILIPVRDLKAAAESRRYVTAQATASMSWMKWIRFQFAPRHIDGGLTTTASRQEEQLARQIYNLIFSLSKTAIPITLLRFPQLVQDASYLFEKLSPVLKGISFTEFEQKFNFVVRQDLVHSFSKDDL